MRSASHAEEVRLHRHCCSCCATLSAAVTDDDLQGTVSLGELSSLRRQRAGWRAACRSGLLWSAMSSLGNHHLQLLHLPSPLSQQLADVSRLTRIPAADTHSRENERAYNVLQSPRTAQLGCLLPVLADLTTMISHLTCSLISRRRSVSSPLVARSTLRYRLSTS